MSKESRERMKAQREHPNNSNPISRRQLLSKLGAFGLGAAALGGTGYFGYESLRDKLSFLNRPILESRSLPWQDVEALYVPVGPGYTPSDSALLAEMEEKANEMSAEDKARNYNAHYNYHFEERKFIVPDESRRYSADTLDHCIRAEDFLHASIKGMKLPRFTWHTVRAGEDFREGFYNKGLIGRANYQLWKISITKNGFPFIDNGKTKLNDGARSVRYDLTAPRHAGEKYMIISTNDSALVAPFSEMLPLNLTGQDLVFAEKWGTEKMHSAVEAFSEAISHNLTYRMLQEVYGYSKEKADARMNIMYTPKMFASSEYSNVKPAIAWTKEHGVQANYDLFMEDIVKFVRTINEYKYKNDLFAPVK